MICRPSASTAVGESSGRSASWSARVHRRGPTDHATVDHHAFGEYEMTAEVASRGRDREAGRAQSACRTAVTGYPGSQGGALQPQGHRVDEAVEETDAAVLLVADGPVGETGDGGSARGEDAGRAEDSGRVHSAAGS